MFGNGFEPSRSLSRRQVLLGGSAAAALGLLTACSTQAAAPPLTIGPDSQAVRRYAASQRRPGASVHQASLSPRQTQVDLGGPIVDTWAFGDTVPGPLLRGNVGDVLRVDVANALPSGTTVHWHGLAVPNNMDGVPVVTQPEIAGNATMTYEFVLPTPGTYWYHSHVGVQRDRGLYGALIIDDPSEPGDYDVDWTVVLDDWIDGTGPGVTPDEALAELRAGRTPGMTTAMSMPGMSMPGMGDSAGGMSMPGMSMTSPLLGGDAGDVAYPYYLLNGRVPAAPVTLAAKPGQRARIRIINAGGDTSFRVALGGHQMTVTHSDGYPVAPVEVDALLIGMGERYDVEVTLGDGAFPLIALAEGKQGQALGVVRTGAGAAPTARVRPAELSGRLLTYADLRATEAVALPEKTPTRTHDLELGGSMMPYRWTINGRAYPNDEPLPVRQGEYVRLRYVNRTSMYHPMHLHGHTFAMRGAASPGPRKDTAIVLPGQTMVADLVADNPGQWVTHCHNVYHEAVGMMTVLSYQR